MVKSNLTSHLSLLTLAVLLTSLIPLYAQEAQYMVFFTDKADTQYSVDQPEAFLSERAIARRAKFNIPVEESDLPVNESYVEQLVTLGAEVFYRTRWMNGVLVQLSIEELEEVRKLSFVGKTEMVKPRARGARKKSGSSIGSSRKLKDPLKENNQLLNVLQNDMLGIDEMHADGYNGKGQLVAIFDGGFRGVDTVSYFSHIFEEDRMLTGYDFVGNDTNVYRYGQHGTEVLSCIGAYREGILEAGAYSADFMLCVTEDVSSEYRIEEYNWLFAAEFADSTGVDIISTSLGYTTFNEADMDYAYEDLDGHSAAITRTLNMASEKGILCVVSAGNEGSGSWRYVSPPADAVNVLAVGAVSNSYDKVSFSSYGPTVDGRIKPDVSALGLQTVVVNAAGNVTRSNGTSFAAPLIAGFAAGIWEAFPEASHLEIIDRIRHSGDKAMTPDNETGFGIPNYERIRRNVLLPIENSLRSHDFRVFPNPLENSDLFIKPVNAILEAPLELHMYDPAGTLVLEKKYVQFNRNSIALDTEALAPGIYILHIATASVSDTLKIVKF